MSNMQFVRAKDGCELRITESGRDVWSIRDKYVDHPQAQYKSCAPARWMTQGYIEEVKIEQNEEVRNVSIWKNV